MLSLLRGESYFRIFLYYCRRTRVHSNLEDLNNVRKLEFRKSMGKYVYPVTRSRVSYLKNPLYIFLLLRNWKKETFKFWRKNPKLVFAQFLKKGFWELKSKSFRTIIIKLLKKKTPPLCKINFAFSML